MNTTLVRTREISLALLVTAVADFGRPCRHIDALATDSRRLLRLGRNLLRSAGDKYAEKSTTKVVRNSSRVLARLVATELTAHQEIIGGAVVEGPRPEGLGVPHVIGLGCDTPLTAAMVAGQVAALRKV
jgi:hypothetical protein